jgi:hypothetical protein
MLESKRQNEIKFKLYRFRAHSVPITTYKQPKFDWKSKKQKFRTRSLPHLNSSSSNIFNFSNFNFVKNERKSNFLKILLHIFIKKFLIC